MFDPRRERTGLNSGSGASGGEGKSTSPGEPNEPDNTEQEFVQHPYGELVGPIDEHSVNGDDESTWSGDDRQDEFERMGELKEEMAMETEAETETEREPPPSAIPMRLQMAKVRTAPGMTKEEVRRANQERRDRVRGGEVSSAGLHSALRIVSHSHSHTNIAIHLLHRFPSPYIVAFLTGSCVFIFLFVFPQDPLELHTHCMHWRRYCLFSARYVCHVSHVSTII